MSIKTRALGAFSVIQNTAKVHQNILFSHQKNWKKNIWGRSTYTWYRRPFQIFRSLVGRGHPFSHSTLKVPLTSVSVTSLPGL